MFILGRSSLALGVEACPRGERYRSIIGSILGARCRIRQNKVLDGALGSGITRRARVFVPPGPGRPLPPLRVRGPYLGPYGRVWAFPGL